MIKAAAYPLAIASALFACLFLYGVAGAVGILGVEGDPADRMYLSVYAVGVIGALFSRFKARGMALTLAAMALTVVIIALIAFAAGMHLSPISSLAELFGVNAIFVAMFGFSAALFWIAAQRRPAAV